MLKWFRRIRYKLMIRLLVPNVNQGGCGYWALDFYDKFGGEIVVVYAENNPHRWVHFMVVLNGKFYDAHHRYSKIANKYDYITREDLVNALDRPWCWNKKFNTKHVKNIGLCNRFIEL